MSQVIDVHVHFGAPDGPEGNCYWSDEFKKTLAYIAMKWVTKSLLKKADYKKVRKHMFRVVRKSRKADKVVLLALDQVYDSNGDACKWKTNLYTSNACIMGLKKEYLERFGEDKILLGMSINPMREDWEEELNKYKADAVLCKWLPSTQMINPKDPKCVPFYKKLAELNIPLLFHAGPEHAIPTWDRTFIKYDGSKYLRYPLENGVTVIAAHCALPFYPEEFDTDFVDLIELMRESDQKGWRLYADLSALCIPFRNPFIKDIQKLIGEEKLLYGSDYPIPMFEFTHKKTSNFLKQLKIFFKAMFTSNPLDKNHYLIKKMGFSQKVFHNAEKVLKLQ
jgi:predicted TIM-barrel fold metal-dependent hydrolase